jgi:uncharacterized OB-fold protein
VGNPIAAAGLMKIAELFWQLRGEAGARQVPGTPQRGLAQAWGDLMQVGTVVVMGVDEPSSPASSVTEPTATLGPTPLSDAEFRAASGAVDTPLDARFAWDPGSAVGSFLDGLRDGRILATTCASCMRTLVPPRAFCERCFRATDAWTQLEAVGTVETFSICHVTWDMRPLEEPELPAVIRIDGSSDGGFLHKLGEVAPDDVRIGMRVEAVWRPMDDRDASILDIAYFRPSEPSIRRELVAAAEAIA